jgi:hypothetical protein
VYGLSTWAFTFLLAVYGNSAEEPWGVVLVGPVAGVLCLLSLGFFACYPERVVIEAAAGDARPRHG